MKRIVVTGMGAITPLGRGLNNNWYGLANAKSGVSHIDKFDVSESETKFAGLIPNHDPLDYFSKKDVRKYDDFVMLGIIAANDAIEDSNFKCAKNYNADKVSTIIGSGIGGIGMIEKMHKVFLEKGAKKVSPFFVPSSIINMIGGNISIKHGFRGCNFAVLSACATGMHAIATGFNLIQSGDADVAIVGGAESPVTPLSMAGFNALKALSVANDNPQLASRPWDSDRDGFVIAEGAGVLVIEDYERALARDAKIYAEIVGIGMSSDAYHITAPDTTGSGGLLAMQQCINQAGIEPSMLDYINAHATSTKLGDLAELQAIKRLFAEQDKSKFLISSTKSMVGHMLGAAGSVELIYTILAMEHGIAPPTINLANIDEDAEGFDFVPNIAKKKDIKYAMSNSFGFGGTNCAMIVSKV